MLQEPARSQVSCFSLSRRRRPAADDAENDTRLYLDQTATVHVLDYLLASIHSIRPSIISASLAPPLLSTTPVCQRSCSHACRYRCWRHHLSPPSPQRTSLQFQLQSTPGWADLHLRPSPRFLYKTAQHSMDLACLLSKTPPPDGTDSSHVVLVMYGPSRLPGLRCSPLAMLARWPVSCRRTFINVLTG